MKKQLEKFNDYQKQAVSLSISLNKLKENYPDLPTDIIKLLSISYDGLGLGEAGEVQGKIKKIIRDNGGIITDEARDAIKSEMGDTLWYLASLAHDLNIELDEIATYNIEKLLKRHKNNTIHGNGDNR